MFLKDIPVEDIPVEDISSFGTVMRLLWKQTKSHVINFFNNKLDSNDKQILNVIHIESIRNNKIFKDIIFEKLRNCLNINFDFFSRKLNGLEEKGFLRVFNDIKESLIIPEEKFYKYFQIK